MKNAWLEWSAMPTTQQHFSLEKVKALRAYFLQLRNGSKNRPEYGDLDAAYKLADQLLGVLEPLRSAKKKASAEGAKE